MPVSSSTEHWIKPDALTINLNHFGDPDYLQVSVLAGAVVMAFKQDVIGYNAAHNYRTWPLEAANTYLETSSAVNVYAKLTRSEVNARALVIYDPILRDIEGREITYNKNEETGEEKELLGESNEDFYFIFLGQISSSISSDGRTVLREWTSEYRSGSLETNEQQNDWMAILNKMFRPHYDDPLNPDLLTWIEAKAHMGIAGGLTSFIDNGSLKLPSIYDGLPIDYQTLYWEEIKEEVGTDEEGNPIYKTTKVLKAKSLGEGGEGGSTGGGLSATEIKTLIESYGYLTESKLPIASNSVKGIASFNSEQFSVINGVVSFIGSTNNIPDLSAYVTKTEFAPFKENYDLLSEVVIQHSVSIREIKNNYATKKYVDDIVSNLSGGSGGEGGVSDRIPWSHVDGKPYWLEDDVINYSEISGTPDLSQYALKTWVNSQGFLKQASLADYATIDYVDELVSNLGGGSGGGTSSGSLSVGESGSGNAYTGYTYLNGKLTLKKEVTFATSSDLSALADSVYSKTNLDNKLKNYVDTSNDQYIEGKKNFVGGLLINRKEIKYNSKGYWELEGDLLVTGGITSFASSSGFTPSTIMDGIVCDEQTITVDVINGVKTLKVIGGGSGTIHWDDIEGAPTSLKNPYALVINGTTYDGSKKVEINISGGSSNTQKIYSLTINDSNGVAQLTYDPSSKKETLELTKSMVGLGNVEDTALSSWKGSNKITTVGTITSGTWQGSEITNDYLAYDYIKIAGQKVSLGESITSATLKTELDIVTLSDEQNINGKKHFNGGLTIGGGEIEYNEDGYWKLTGNLLVTGGITSYASDGKATPFLINVDTWESILSESTTQVYSAKAVTLLKNEVQSVGVDADSALAKLEIIKEELSTLTDSSLTTAIRKVLLNIKNKI